MLVPGRVSRASELALRFFDDFWARRKPVFVPKKAAAEPGGGSTDAITDPVRACMEISPLGEEY